VQISAYTQWYPDKDIIILSVRPECPPSCWQEDLARAEDSRMTEQVAYKWWILWKAENIAMQCIKCIEIPKACLQK